MMKKTRSIVPILVFLFIVLFNLFKVSAKSVDVKTFKEFEDALLDRSVTNINVTKSIKFRNNVYEVPKRDLIINGNKDKDVIIDSGNNFILMLMEVNKTVPKISIVNANIKTEVSQYNTSLSFIKDEVYETDYYLKDVYFYGNHFLYAPYSRLILDGSNTMYTLSGDATISRLEFKSNSIYKSSSNNSTFNIIYSQFKSIVMLEENSKVYLNMTSRLATAFSEDLKRLHLEPGSLLDIGSVDAGLTLSGDTTISHHATLSIHDYYDDPKTPSINRWSIPIDTNRLIVNDGTITIYGDSNINIKGNIKLNNSILNIDNPLSFNINSGKLDEGIIDADNKSKINFTFNNDISFWDIKQNNNPNPTHTFTSISGTFINDVSSTNNKDFDKVFNPKNISKLTVNSKGVNSYKVTFDTAGGSENPPDQLINSGEKVNKPPNPTKQGYIFDGWYYQPKWYMHILAWDFNLPVTFDLKLFAHWKDQSPTQQLTVTFDTNGGSTAPKSQNVSWSEKITKPEKPTREGYIFEGWAKDKLGATIWNFDTDVVRNSFTLYAIWIKPDNNKTYTVNFDSRGGNSVKSVKNIKSGSLIKMPTTPKKANNVFGGWYADKEFTIRWIFTKSRVYENITLYGKWSNDN